VQLWSAHYEEYGRQIGRSDMNAADKVQRIGDTHRDKYNYASGCRMSNDHVPARYEPDRTSPALSDTMGGK